MNCFFFYKLDSWSKKCLTGIEYSVNLGYRPTEDKKFSF